MGVIDRFLAGDYPITFVVLLIVWLWASRNRSTVRDIVHDRNPVWAWSGRVTLGAAVFLPVWIALADNWRQVLGYGVNERTRWMSDPFQAAPPPDLVRGITFVLIGIVVVGAATIYARRRGSLGLALLLLPVSAGFFFFLNAIRMRADALLRIATEGHLVSEHPVNIAFTLFWSLGLYFVIASLIFAGFFVLVCLVAIPLRLVFMVFERREAEREAAVFSRYRETSIAQSSGAIDDQSRTGSSSVGDQCTPG